MVFLSASVFCLSFVFVQALVFLLDINVDVFSLDF